MRWDLLIVQVSSVHSTLGKTAQDLHLLEAKSTPTLESQVRLESLVPPVQPTSQPQTEQGSEDRAQSRFFLQTRWDALCSPL